jgi:hypothetical protein
MKKKLPKYLFIVLTGIFWLTGLIIIWLTYQHGKDLWMSYEKMSAVQAEIVSLKIVQEKDNLSRLYKAQIRNVYRFTYEDNTIELTDQSINNRLRISKDWVGKNVEILYSPTLIDRTVINSFWPKWNSLLLMAVFALFWQLLSTLMLVAHWSIKKTIIIGKIFIIMLLLFGTLLWGNAIQKLADVNRFQKQAEKTNGEIVAWINKSGQKINHFSYTNYNLISYECEGKQYQARSTISTRKLKSNLGQQQTILIDPDNCKIFLIDSWDEKYFDSLMLMIFGSLPISISYLMQRRR